MRTPLHQQTLREPCIADAFQLCTMFLCCMSEILLPPQMASSNLVRVAGVAHSGWHCSAALRVVLTICSGITQLSRQVCSPARLDALEGPCWQRHIRAHTATSGVHGVAIHGVTGLQRLQM